MPVVLSEEQATLFAAAIFEIRVLLQSYSGEDVDIRLAERLAYALHNDALSVIDGKATFDVDDSRQRITVAQEIVGARFPDGFGLLLQGYRSDESDRLR